jgi:hypothetical protein
MSGSENKELIRRLYAEVGRGNAQPFLDALADDLRWTLIGSTKYSGTFEGKQAVLDRLLMPALGQLEGPLAIEPENFIAEGDLVVMQAKGKARTKSGKRYDNTYCYVFRIVNGKIQEITEYCDTEVIRRALD